MVTMPAVPPYSSTATATWLRSFCISRSRSPAFLVSGTKNAGRIAVDTCSDSASRLMCVLRTRSFRYTIPTMSSSLSPVTGIREKPERRARVRAWRMVL
ncbi:hypothetical protein SVIOM74S_01458 [Streptomyces violarus]